MQQFSISAAKSDLCTNCDVSCDVTLASIPLQVVAIDYYNSQEGETEFQGKLCVLCYLSSSGFSSSNSAVIIRNDEVVGSIPTSSTKSHNQAEL